MWQDKYLIPHTVVFDKVSVRAASKIIGMVYAERHWGDVKLIKSGKCSHISTENTDKPSTIYTWDRLKKKKLNAPSWKS